MKLAIFYHCLLELGNPPEVLPNAVRIVREQMDQLRESGLMEAAEFFMVGVNGEEASFQIANLLIPPQAEIVLHGLRSRSENMTILEVERFAKYNPGWYILYFHCKGATHCLHSRDGQEVELWRNCMMRQCVYGWERAVNFLSEGYDACGVHWRTGVGGDRSQHYFAGTFFWVKSSFFRMLPSIRDRAQCRKYGLDSLEARYEAEVVLGNGPKLPKVKDLDTSHEFYHCGEKNNWLMPSIPTIVSRHVLTP